jgi:hypothetical protein
LKVQVKSYVFDSSARTITFSDYASIDIDSVLYVINVTDNRAIYNPMNKNLKGSVFGNVLTLNYDTTTMSDDDELMIYYDNIPDPATEAKQDDMITELNEIKQAIADQTFDTSLLATEETLQKTVGFDVNSNITTTIVTAGAIKTITETDGVKTNTTTVDKTDPLDIQITNIWS